MLTEGSGSMSPPEAESIVLARRRQLSVCQDQRWDFRYKLQRQVQKMVLPSLQEREKWFIYSLLFNSHSSLWHGFQSPSVRDR